MKRSILDLIAFDVWHCRRGEKNRQVQMELRYRRLTLEGNEKAGREGVGGTILEDFGENLYPET